MGHLRYALFDESPLADEYDVVCCGRCGLVTCDTPDSQQEHDRFYRKYEYSPASLRSAASRLEETYFAEIVELLAPYLSRHEPLLDIGCGSGKLLTKCRELQFENLFAIDLSEACIDSLRRSCYQAAVGSLSEIPFPDVSPGVLALAHVLEHVVALKEGLRGVRERLRDGGVLYVEVPDTQRLQDFCEGSPLQFFYPQHLVHFDELHLNNLFSTNGFRRLGAGTRIRPEHEIQIPSVWSLFAFDDRSSPVPRSDFGTARKVKSWFEGVGLDASGVFSNLAQTGVPVYVWGVGIHVQMMLGMSPLRDCNIVCCVDQDPKLHQKRIAGHAIESIEILGHAGEEATVVIGSRIHRQAMLTALRDEFRFSGRVVTV